MSTWPSTVVCVDKKTDTKCPHFLRERNLSSVAGETQGPLSINRHSTSTGGSWDSGSARHQCPLHRSSLSLFCLESLFVARALVFGWVEPFFTRNIIFVPNTSYVHVIIFDLLFSESFTWKFMSGNYFPDSHLYNIKVWVEVLV